MTVAPNGAKVVVTVPELTPTSPVSTAASRSIGCEDDAPLQQADDAASAHADAQANPGSTQRILAIVGAGVGVALLTGSAVYVGKAKSTNDESYQHGNCTGNACSPDGLPVRQLASSQARTATILFGVGTAALVGGAVLWFTAPKAEPVTVGLSFGPQQIAVTGTW